MNLKPTQGGLIPAEVLRSEVAEEVVLMALEMASKAFRED